MCVYSKSNETSWTDLLLLTNILCVLVYFLISMSTFNFLTSHFHLVAVTVMGHCVVTDSSCQCMNWAFSQWGFINHENCALYSSHCQDQKDKEISRQFKLGTSAYTHRYSCSFANSLENQLYKSSSGLFNPSLLCPSLGFEKYIVEQLPKLSLAWSYGTCILFNFQIK